MEIYLFSRDDMVIKIVENSIKSINLPLRVFTNFDFSFIETEPQNTLILMDDSISNFSSINKSKFARILIHRKNIPQLEGFDGYVSKPFLPRDIIDTVNEYMNSSEKDNKESDVVQEEGKPNEAEEFDFERKFRELELAFEGKEEPKDEAKNEPDNQAQSQSKNLSEQEERDGRELRENLELDEDSEDFGDFSKEGVWDLGGEFGDDILEFKEPYEETQNRPSLLYEHQLSDIKSVALEALKSIDLESEDLNLNESKLGEEGFQNQTSQYDSQDHRQEPYEEIYSHKDLEESFNKQDYSEIDDIDNKEALNLQKSGPKSILSEREDEIESLKQMLREVSIPKEEESKPKSELDYLEVSAHKDIINQIKSAAQRDASTDYKLQDESAVETKAQMMAKVDLEISQISIDESDILEALNRPLIDKVRDKSNFSGKVGAKDIKMDGDDFIDFIKQTPKDELKSIFGSGRVNLFINFKG